jgi:hypothetical protein
MSNFDFLKKVLGKKSEYFENYMAALGERECIRCLLTIYAAK